MMSQPDGFWLRCCEAQSDQPRVRRHSRRSVPVFSRGDAMLTSDELPYLQDNKRLFLGDDRMLYAYNLQSLRIRPRVADAASRLFLAGDNIRYAPSH